MEQFVFNGYVQIHPEADKVVVLGRKLKLEIQRHKQGEEYEVWLAKKRTSSLLVGNRSFLITGNGQMAFGQRFRGREISYVFSTDQSSHTSSVCLSDFQIQTSEVSLEMNQRIQIMNVRNVVIFDRLPVI